MMGRLREWMWRLRGTFAGPDSLEDELRSHLEMAVEDAARRGLPVREARLRAGGLAQASEAVRDQGKIGWLSDLLRDSRHGARLLAGSPLFTAAAIVSLALGIGANTAIFSLIDAVVLRHIPVHEPERLVQFIKIHGTSSRRDISYPLFVHLRDQARGFDGLLAQAPMGRKDVLFEAEAETIHTEVVSGNYYSLLGISAVAGRVFDGDSPGPDAVISYAFWKRRFGLDPGIIGKTFRLNRTVFTIIGVAPPGFHGVIVGAAPEVTFPLSVDGEVRGGESWHRFDTRSWLSVMGRVRKEQSFEQAQAEAAAVFSRLGQSEAGRQNNERFRTQTLDQRMRLKPAGNGLDELQERFSEPLRLLMGIVALVLLIACANLANLLLGRAAARRREISVRLAMGAGRGRVIRQLLTEGLLLAAAGGGLGVVLACWSANALVTMMSNGGDRIAIDILPDARVLGFAMIVSIVACLLFSLAPAIQATRQGIQPGLTEGRGSSQWRLGRGLIAAQVAISLLLLIGAGLFGRTLLNVYAMENGFDGNRVTLFSVSADRAALQGQALRSRVMRDLRLMPGITSASYGFSPIGPTGWNSSMRIEGHTFGPNESDMAQLNFIGPDYFKTLRTPVLAGREFNERDTETSSPVAMVNQTFARRFLADQAVLGKWVNIAGEPERMEIVGVVEDVKSRSFRRETEPAVFIVSAQRGAPTRGGVYLVRGNVDAAVIDTALKRIDPALRAVDLRSLDEHLSRSILRERLLGMLAGLFGGLSLLLVCVGVYGVMGFHVVRRQREIGIRMALGARPMEVIGMILREAMLPVLIGAAVGIGSALGLTQLAEKTLFGVKPTDPLTFAGACLLLVTLALAAGYFPSRAAARISPVDALRCE